MTGLTRHQRCRMLHNFSSMVAIVSGLNTPHIRRLKRTWEQVNARTMGQLSLCESLIDSTKNFSNYRRTLEKVTPPCVPFFGEMRCVVFHGRSLSRVSCVRDIHHNVNVYPRRVPPISGHPLHADRPPQTGTRTCFRAA